MTNVVSRRKPHSHHAGYIAMRRHPTLKGPDAHVTIYEAAEQGIDVGGARYAVVCGSHATIVGDTSLRGARATMKYPAQFCDECRSLAV